MGLLAAAWRRTRRTRLAGKVVLITGGSRGLGLALARQFAGRGARLVLCARDPQELARARATLEAAGAEVETVIGDVGVPADMERAVATAAERFGPVDVLVNDASIIQVAPVEALGLADYQAALAANFWGTVHASLAVLPQMRRRRRGTIVNITSIGGAVAIPHLLPYSAAKFAARGFSEGLFVEAARDGVRVVTVLPGLMRTGSFLNALVKGQRHAEVRWFSVAASLPLLTLDAGRAARRILRATERGRPFVVVGLPAQALRIAHALFPGLVLRGLALAGRLLPRSAEGEAERPAAPARRYQNGMARSWLTLLGARAAAALNE